MCVCEKERGGEGVCVCVCVWCGCVCACARACVYVEEIIAFACRNRWEMEIPKKSRNFQGINEHFSPHPTIVPPETEMSVSKFSVC